MKLFASIVLVLIFAVLTQAGVQTRYDGLFVSATMNISAYTDCSAMPSCWGITASGKKTSIGTVAAGSNIPFGTKVFIPHYGLGRIEDRGGAISDAHLDVWYKEYDDAMQFGRRYEEVRFFVGESE